ncbi:hypothetical protein pb186bvf_016295 [Paramecium bursaria]
MWRKIKSRILCGITRFIERCQTLKGPQLSDQILIFYLVLPKSQKQPFIVFGRFLIELVLSTKYRGGLSPGLLLIVMFAPNDHKIFHEKIFIQ